MTHTLTPTIIGTDQGVELTGTAQIPFTVTGKPAFENGEQRISPIDGQVTVTVTGGRYVATFAQIDGFLVNEGTGKPARKKTRILFDFPASEDEHPDYLPPDWLITFVAGLEGRLNGETEA